MPLYTELKRKSGRHAKMYGWTAWHLDALHKAMVKENDGEEEGVEYFPMEYVFKKNHKFQELEQNILVAGGFHDKVFTLRVYPGDTYKCWRNSWRGTLK